MTRWLPVPAGLWKRRLTGYRTPNRRRRHRFDDRQGTAESSDEREDQEATHIFDEGK
jgi:hypothetical protein